MNIDLAREINDRKLLREWNGEEPKYPLRKKVDPDYGDWLYEQRKDRELEE